MICQETSSFSKMLTNRQKCSKLVAKFDGNLVTKCRGILRSQRSKMELFAKKNTDFQLATIFTKGSIFDFQLVSRCTSEMSEGKYSYRSTILTCVW